MLDDTQRTQLYFRILWYQDVLTQYSVSYLVVINLANFSKLVSTYFVIYIVYESFKDYITVESLDGDNRYDAGDFGLQVS